MSTKVKNVLQPGIYWLIKDSCEDLGHHEVSVMRRERCVTVHSSYSHVEADMIPILA
jgi:hypothetical protein